MHKIHTDIHIIIGCIALQSTCCDGVVWCVAWDRKRESKKNSSGYSQGMSPLYYRIHGTFDSDFNLVVGPFWLQTPSLMYTNTSYNHVYCEQCALNIALFAKLKCLPMCVCYTPIHQTCSPNILLIQYYLNIYIVPLHGFYCLYVASGNILVQTKLLTLINEAIYLYIFSMVFVHMNVHM